MASQKPMILNFRLAHMPRATRAKLPKVRTGCIACKRRHVKCDEAKPDCSRCIKWRGYCSGYETRPSPGSSPPPAKAKPRPRKKRTDSPQSEYDIGERSFHQCDADLTRANSMPPPIRWDDWQQDPIPDWLQLPDLTSPDAKVVVALESLCGPAFWSDEVPRLSRKDEAIKMAVNAVRAMAAAKSPSSAANLFETEYGGSESYRKALKYYGEALRTVRQATGCCVAQRSAIICCLLFVVFEVIHGDSKAAEAHLQSGEAMVAGVRENLLKLPPTLLPPDLSNELWCVLEFLEMGGQRGVFEQWLRDVRPFSYLPCDELMAELDLGFSC